MASSNSSTPLAIIDDNSLDFISTGMFPYTPMLGDMISASYNKSLTFSTEPSWNGTYIFDGVLFIHHGRPVIISHAPTSSGTYTRIAVYICVPPGAIDIAGTAYANYILDGTPAGGNYYVPLTNRDLFVPRFAHFISEEMLAIPGGTHNLTIEASGTPNHPYLLDYIVLWNQYLGPNDTYLDGPTYVSTLGSTPTSTTPTRAVSAQPGVTSVDISSVGTTSLSSILTSSTGSAPADTLPSASSQPSSNTPPTSHIVGAVTGSVVAAAALVALSYFVYYRRRRRGGVTAVPTEGESDGIVTSPYCSNRDA